MDGVCLMAKITIGWAPLIYDCTKGLALFIKKPESVYDTHIKEGEYKYKQCPATNSLTKNTFIVRSPFDANFVVDVDSHTLELIPPFVQPNDFFNMRKGQYGPNDQPLMSLNFHQIVLTEHEKVEATITAPWFEEAQNDFRVIPGRFMISDWWRPLDFAMQLRTRKQVVKIKRDEPLFYITISTKDPDDIAVMREVRLTEELKSFLNIATDSKYYQPRCPLKTLYGAFKHYIKRGHRPKLEFID
jgi:hypothetical protein